SRFHPLVLRAEPRLGSDTNAASRSTNAAMPVKTAAVLAVPLTSACGGAWLAKLTSAQICQPVITTVKMAANVITVWRLLRAPDDAMMYAATATTTTPPTRTQIALM